jgi:hypothetical protein
MKEKINIIFLGHIPNKGLERNIKKWKSNLFEIDEITVVNNLPNPKHKRSFLSQSFNDAELSSIIGHDTSNFRIGIIFADLEQDYYARVISPKSVIISIKSVQPYLSAAKISTENFLKRTLYMVLTIFFEMKNNPSENPYAIPHIETRGCLFDLNGDLMDVIHNTENPIICTPCLARLSTKNLQPDYIRNLKNELSKIRKSRFERLESFIKCQPLLSLLITIILGILLNIVANFIYDGITMKINSSTNNSVQIREKK